VAFKTYNPNKSNRLGGADIECGRSGAQDLVGSNERL